MDLLFLLPPILSLGGGHAGTDGDYIPSRNSFWLLLLLPAAVLLVPAAGVLLLVDGLGLLGDDLVVEVLPVIIHLIQYGPSLQSDQKEQAVGLVDRGGQVANGGPMLYGRLEDASPVGGVQAFSRHRREGGRQLAADGTGVHSAALLVVLQHPQDTVEERRDLLLAVAVQVDVERIALGHAFDLADACGAGELGDPWCLLGNHAVEFLCLPAPHTPFHHLDCLPQLVQVVQLVPDLLQRHVPHLLVHLLLPHSHFRWPLEVGGWWGRADHNSVPWFFFLLAHLPIVILSYGCLTQKKSEQSLKLAQSYLQTNLSQGMGMFLNFRQRSVRAISVSSLLSRLKMEALLFLNWACWGRGRQFLGGQKKSAYSFFLFYIFRILLMVLSQCIAQLQGRGKSFSFLLFCSLCFSLNSWVCSQRGESRSSSKSSQLASSSWKPMISACLKELHQSSKLLISLAQRCFCLNISAISSKICQNYSLLMFSYWNWSQTSLSNQCAISSLSSFVSFFSFFCLFFSSCYIMWFIVSYILQPLASSSLQMSARSWWGRMAHSSMRMRSFSSSEISLRRGGLVLFCGTGGSIFQKSLGSYHSSLLFSLLPFFPPLSSSSYYNRFAFLLILTQSCCMLANKQYHSGRAVQDLRDRLGWKGVSRVYILIKLMKSNEKLASRLPRTEQAQLQQSTQFQKFKDEQFVNHRKGQFTSHRYKHKSINSLSVYTLVNQTINEQLNLTLEPQPQPSPSPRGENVRESRGKIGKDCTLMRYSRNDLPRGTEFKFSQQEKELIKSSQKINLIKKILDLYNSKSVERTYYSNLINNLAKNSPVPDPNPKAKSVTIKKIHPKNSYRKNFKKTPENPFKVGQLNMHGFDLVEEYYNHSSIALEAQGMNELIKDFLERKRQSKSSESQSAKPRGKARSNQGQKQGKQGKVFRKTHSKFQTLSEIKAKLLQNMSDNSVNHKVNKFREFLFMVNFASGVYRPLDIQRYDSPFRIFVGKGNNGNLIRSIIKKRFWFELTKNREEAHFVWTQLKEEEVHARQGREEGKSESELEEALLAETKAMDEKEEEQALATLEKSMDTMKSKLSQKFSSKAKAMKVQSSQHLKILTDTQSKQYNKLISEFTVKKRYKFSDRLRYIRSITSIPLSQLSQCLIHNHLPLNGLLGNKKALFYMLREYYRLTGQDLFATVPPTFHVKKGFLDEEFRSFMGKFLQGKERNYWIIKPGEFSNRGQGITCTDRLQDIRARVAGLRRTGRGRSLILQKYIANPLLYNGRKFDIRAYMLLTVNNGKLRAYWYQDGYIRTSSSPWSLESMTDPLVHLTNDAIQKHSPSYGKFEPGNKLTYSELQRYLDSLPRNNPCNFQTDIYPILKQIAADCVRATACFIDPVRKGCNFEIFGLDFMVDSAFKPWLIQVNTNPCLEVSCPVLQRIIPSMVQNAFRIAVDPLFPPPLNFPSVHKYSIPENALHYNKFELVFDELRDGGELRRVFAGSRVVQSIDEYEQDKEVYEQQGQEVVEV